MNKKLSASCVAVVVLCASCVAPNGTQTPAILLPTVAPNVVTEVPQPSPTVALFTPTLTSTPKQAPTEKDALAALCWVECRGMEEARDQCCASVIDTVFTRIDARQMSDCTVFGTLRWGCTEDTQACQFPAYVTRGCEGIASPCPFDDADGLRYFSGVVDDYYSGELEPQCGNYLFYDLGLEQTECSIVADNGQFVIFHDKWERTPPTPTPITPTASIIEVTPIGGGWGVPFGKIETVTGIYTVGVNVQNVRWGPGMDYSRRYTLGYGQTVPFYAWVSSLPFEAWLCLDQPLGPGIGVLCTEAIALVYDGDEFGEVVFDD